MPPIVELTAALRFLRRSPGVAAAATLMLTVAIAAISVIFGIVHAVLIRPLPFQDPDRLVVLWGRNDARAQQVVEVSLSEWREWRTRNMTFSALEILGSVNWSYRVTAPGGPFSVSYSPVSGSFFDTLGARAMLGRTFRPDEDTPGARRTAIITADLWRRRFSSNPRIVGTSLTIGEGAAAQPFEIIGVMPPDFRFPAGAELWTPATRDMAEHARRNGGQDDSADYVRVFYVLGRLKGSAAADHARVELTTIARRFEASRGERDSGILVVVTPLVVYLFGPARPALAALFAAVAILLLIACANVAGLLLVQGVARQKEMAVRMALGASRPRVIRQLLAEAAIVVASSGAAGIALAVVSFRAIVALSPAEVPRLDQASIDFTVVLFTIAVCLVTVFIVGGVPAWQVSRAQLVETLQQGGRAGTASTGAGRLRQLLVVAQLAAALVLLTGAGLLARSFVALMRVDLGFNPENVLTFQVAAPEPRYPTVAKQRALVDDVLAQASRIDGVIAAGAIYERPFEHGPIGMDSNFIAEGQAPSEETRNPILNWESVTPGYFRAMDIGLLRGRLFDERDDEDAPRVVIVGEALASRVWPGLNPLGQRLRAYGADDGKWQTVVGVVEDARYREVQGARFDFYVPFRQAPSPVQYFVVRTFGDPLAIAPALRARVTGLDPSVTVDNVTTMEAVVSRTMAPWRFNTQVFAAFSAVALAFAAVGLFALIAFAVKQRTREIGVRVALGAQAGDVIRMVVGEGARLTLAGLAVGMPAAWALSRFLSSLLFGVKPTDALTFACVAGLLAAVSLAAAYVPARRAARIDPVAALRRE